MWIRVRSIDGKSFTIIGLSKLTKIEDLRKKLVEKFDAPVEQQKLYFKGKQLEDGHTLFDYNMKLNDLIDIKVNQIENNIRPLDEASTSKKKDKENTASVSQSNMDTLESNKVLSKYFKNGAIVDAKDLDYGAWFEAKIIDIRASEVTEKPVSLSTQSKDNSPVKANLDMKDDQLIYRVVFEDYEDENPADLPLQNIRPRARKLLKFEDIEKGEQVMINYNMDDPTVRGFWYDCIVTDKKVGKTSKHLIGTIIFGSNQTQLENSKVKFTDEIFAIEKNSVISAKIPSHSNEDIVIRQKMISCSHCKDIPTKKCKFCNCHVCGGKEAPEKQILCDECDLSYHLWCLKPPLDSIPEEAEWYCPDCKNDTSEIVNAGERLKESRKKSKMASATSSTSRDWGKGMACVGRTKECTLVPSNHFGPIPGVEVGMLWKYRVQVSEAGVHRPHVAGISGREKEGAFSLVLSGGYEDDLDEGEEFKYTGSGGRDLSGNKRCAAQSCDQELTRMNKALAINCKAVLNKKGAESTNWREGKPVRVVRNYKGKKHSKYSPEDGNRYDGIYKVVKYWQEKGKSGFFVWRYLLRRDDPTPPPWTKAGKKRCEELGFTMQYPEGYLESQAAKEENTEMEVKTDKKRKRNDGDIAICQTMNKRKSTYVIPAKVQQCIERDTLNKKLWEECLTCVTDGAQAFLKQVEETFTCICCQEVIYQPITTVCFHNICKPCLERSFKANVFSCPICRQELEKTCRNQVNKNLQEALVELFPGYVAGR